MADSQFDVLIIGGGFSGTLLAVHLLRQSPSLSVGVVERRGEPGRGLAYSSPHRFHLLNVPAVHMSALPDEPHHFLNWAKANYDASVQPRSFLSRSLYGEYVGDLLQKTVVRSGVGRFRWIQDEALSLHRRRGFRSVQLRNGPELSSRAVVLAVGNFPPADPRIPGLRHDSPTYFPFAWAPNALEGLSQNGRVLLIGSGLTAVDMIMGLKSKGFRGSIHVISRKGLLPHRHRSTETWPPFWNAASPRTTRGLLRLIRDQVQSAADRGIDWRSVIDSLRPVNQEIWRSLPSEEKKRFLRHVRSFWDVHRHRIAPEIGDLLADMRAEGQVVLHRGRILRYSEQSSVAEVTYRERGHTSPRKLQVERVINCTGSETDCRRIEDSLIASLFVQGFAHPDPIFLGLDVDADGALIDYQGFPSHALFAIGPSRKGCLWETTAVPEIRGQAQQLSSHLVRLLDKQYARPNDALEAAV